MKKSDFYYDLPEELIAQDPLEKRDEARLMTLDKTTGEIGHHHFYDIVDMLNPGDTLILNDSRVIPARIYGKKEVTGGHMEFLLLTQKEKDVWEVLTKPGRIAKVGTRFDFGDGLLKAEVIDVLEDGNRIVKFEHEGRLIDIIEKIGEMPTPPYIKHKLKDKEAYQTVYSRELGSAAAPTAGLHFTKELLQKIKDKGINIGYVTLHVGVGTFRPVKTENIEEHKMHFEHYEMSKETADLINNTKKAGKRVIAVGTTSCRTIETVSHTEGGIKASEGWTGIFIYPGYEFKCMDALITNFHLPESTLVMLVSALAGREHILNAYKEAVKEKYRFFSFGDAMFIH